MKKTILVWLYCLIFFSTINAYSLSYVYDYSGIIITAHTVMQPSKNDSPFSVGDTFSAELIFNGVGVMSQFDLEFGHERLVQNVFFRQVNSNGDILANASTVSSLCNYTYDNFIYSPNSEQSPGIPDFLQSLHFSTDYTVPGDHVVLAGDLKFNVTPVSEPSVLILLCAGLSGISLMRKRCRKWLFAG